MSDADFLAEVSTEFAAPEVAGLPHKDRRQHLINLLVPAQLPVLSKHGFTDEFAASLAATDTVPDASAGGAVDATRIDECVNELCPWSGKPVSADSLALYRGHVVGFCNPGCRDKFVDATTDFDNALAYAEAEAQADESDSGGDSDGASGANRHPAEFEGVGWVLAQVALQDHFADPLVVQPVAGAMQGVFQAAGLLPKAKPESSEANASEEATSSKAE